MEVTTFLSWINVICIVVINGPITAWSIKLWNTENLSWGATAVRTLSLSIMLIILLTSNIDKIPLDVKYWS